MSLRGRFLLYLTVVHLVFFAVTWVLLGRQRLWLIAVELFFGASLALGWWLIRRLTEPNEVLRTGVELLDSEDLMSRFRETGRPEVDRLIRLYNRMVDHLREERTANQEQDSLLRRLIALSPTGVVQLDYDGRIQSLNPGARAILGLTDDAAGKPLAQVHPDLAHDLLGMLDGEARLVTLRGRRRIRCTRLTFMDRGFARSCLLLEELTRELHASEKAAYEKLIRTMSHEINNTSGAVISLLGSCLHYAGQITEPDRRDFVSGLEVATARTRHMNEFMKRFADVVRLPPPDRNPASLPDLLRDVARLVEPERARRRIAWHWRVEERTPPVSMDRVQMEQALVNIVRNAFEAIGEDGEVIVGLETRQGVPELTIEDSGGGIPPEVAPRLFTSFFTTKPEGQGIGLTVVQEILISHGFDFGLETVAPGRSAFSIRFTDRK